MKGILKTGPKSDKTEKHLAFDEGNLCDNERARPEGGYMTIDEPKTPFARENSDQDNEDLEDEEDAQIQQVLQKAKEEASKLAKASDKASDFEAKRREHYRKQEGEVIRMAKKKKEVSKKE